MRQMTDCTIVSEHLHDEKPEELISLMEKLHGREDINRMIEAVEDERLSIEDVFSVALENKTKSGFHAAWVLEKLCAVEQINHTATISVRSKPILNIQRRLTKENVTALIL